MNDLEKAAYPGINYNCCICADEKTFIHTAFFKTAEDQQLLNELPSFKYFQEALRAAGFELPPAQELLNLVGSSNKIFN